MFKTSNGRFAFINPGFFVSLLNLTNRSEVKGQHLWYSQQNENIASYTAPDWRNNHLFIMSSTGGLLELINA